jgi:4-methylaminobutanoate oxidase (formaldehyde-forming)
LCTFSIEGDKPVLLRGSEPIIRNGNVVGVTTSGGYGHTVRKTIAYGYLSCKDAENADGYEIEVYKELFPAKFEPSRALYDPERKKILS